MASKAIYIAPPGSPRGPWRVTCQGQTGREFPTQAEATRYAALQAGMIQTLGNDAVIKIEKNDGTWEIFPI